MTKAMVAIYAAALLSMVSALFGIALARLIWAEDLKFTLELKENWDATQRAYEGTIEAQRKQIEMLKK